MRLGTCDLLALAVFAAIFLTVVQATYYCKAPSSVRYGRHSGGHYRYFKVGTVIRYWCKSGYRLQGYSQTTCYYSRTMRTYRWTRPPPSCVPYHTDDVPDNDDNDSSTDSSDFSSSRDDSSRSRDDSSSSRDDSSNSSRGKGCDKPKRPDNGWVKYRHTMVGARAWYLCNSGYTRVGSESRTCKPSGKWEPEVPVCKRPGDGCEKLVSPKHGIVIYSSTSVGSYAKYFCEDSYYLVGIRFRKCKEDGWTDKAPICKPIVCDYLPRLKNGRIKFSDGNRMNSVAIHSCNYGFWFKEGHGDIKRVCSEAGSWSGSPPLCICA